MARFDFLLLFCSLGIVLLPTQQVSANILTSFWKSFCRRIGWDESPKTYSTHTNSQYCDLNGDTGECCLPIYLKELNINDRACVKLSYLPKDIGFEADVLWNQKTIYKRSLSVRNPPSLCEGLPFLNQVDICLIFYDVVFKYDSFSTCIKFRIQFYAYEDFKLTCFSLPLLTESQSSHRLFKRALFTAVSK
ncbi:uncharacterized protein LOC106881424 [Octopus bimaculoides]|uniref:DUF4773 domain-containing protein n=1 Tax=Octopus bimaculoides TaxID=37653 RepID=A0A0L8FSN1_OCTBM|nr:uncharacterized protein LOC106881424 [Octopus bimaculoides]|eukprot:XP_014787297.1 PREDICTED: uncharacterized protein LOC106881424 [Octopus bimaculoides]